MTWPLYSVFHVVLSTQSLPACGETSHCTSLGAVALTAPRSRIVQRKMSMKLAKWRERCPMQDEHEKVKNRVGVARPGASVYAECREPQPGTDPRLSQIERTDR